MNVEIEVYYHTDQTSSLQKMDMGFHITDCETRTMTFCNIVGFAPADDAKIIMLVRLEHPQTNELAAATVVPLWTDIFLNIANDLEIPRRN